MSEPAKTLEDIERVGGSPAVDFVNTVSAWNAETRTDYLATFADFLRWNELNGLLWPAAIQRFRQRPAAEQAEALREAQALRDALYRIFLARTREEPLPVDALDYLNELIRRTVSWRRISGSSASGGRDICCVWDFTDAPAIAALGPVAWAAADMLENAPLERVKECPGENCGWLFLDTSKNRSRQWCSMKTCGNVAKVKRFRQKRD